MTEATQAGAPEEVIGTTRDGRPVRRFTLTAPSGARLQVLDAGASAMSYRLDGEDPATEMLVGFDTVEGFENGIGGGYFGAVVGRYANRIAGGRFTIDGVEHQVSTNEGGNTLHGGVEGFSHRTWSVVSSSRDQVTFELTSPDGDQGFPGELVARARYELLADGFALALSAVTDQATPVCLTSHLYVNLASGGSAYDHTLQVHADEWLPIDGESLPQASGLASVEGTPFDLREPVRIGDAVSSDDPQVRAVRGIDHSFEILGDGLREVAVLTEPVTGRVLRLVADAPALQVYCGNFLDGSLVSRNGALGQGHALALEPDVHPDSPNQDWAGDVVLRPGDEWTSRIEWHFAG
ncbi:aldose epimerase family protein [Propionibacteriaceae bacterium G1746]|uniref:aldose epimerase family protein n=1 Tax=Aestuariimicrobium sp. G57 TaxID=3418485 RepID=UPI003C28259F